MNSSNQPPFENDKTRREFLRKISLGVSAGIFVAPGFLAQSCSSDQSQNQQQTQDSTTAQTQEQPPAKKLGVALVGLGNYSTGQLAPALQETKLCRLAGIITGTPEKGTEWVKKYNLSQKDVYTYDTFDQIKDNEDIDIVYVVLPNSMHAEYTIRAAQAGKHVICEKPMATSVRDCQAMIDACKKNNRKLSIGYRLHFEPHNREMMRLGQEKVFGPITKIEGGNGFPIGDPTQWRLDKKLAGGGPLMDVGIYVIQGVIYTLGEEPVAVTARQEKTDKKKFAEVEETLYWTMEFPSGMVADCETSYAKGMAYLRAQAQNGSFELSPAYGYDGLQGKTGNGPMNFPQVREQALHMDDFADCIMNNKETRVPGEMGLRDVRIMTAIYRAMESGKKEKV